MAVMTEFLDLIVPVAIIEEKYPGGWAQCLRDHQPALNARVWFDEHLFRDGAMNPEAMEALLKEWWKLGFDCYEERDGKTCWKDLCVYDGSLSRSPVVCDWLLEDAATRSVYLKGTPMGEVVGRDWELIDDDWEPPKFPGE